MTDLRAAAELALDVLEAWLVADVSKLPIVIPQTENAVFALRQALAQPEQEPVHFLANGVRYKVTHQGYYGCSIVGLPENLNGQWVALVEATDSKHLNCIAHQESTKPEQEPVAWMDKNGVPSTYKSELYSIPLYTLHHSTTQGLIECTHNRYSYDVTDDEATCRDCGAQGRMIFVVNGTAPPSKPWVSLTDEEIIAINHKAATDYEDGLTYARAIEATLRSKNK